MNGPPPESIVAEWRIKYAQILAQLKTELDASYRDRVGDIERSGCWREYGALAVESMRAQGCVILLRAALGLHLLHLPGPKDLAILACNLVRICA